MGRTKKEQLWEKQRGFCYYCQARLRYPDANTDHLHPKSLGGSNGLDNRVLCCVEINRWFGNMPFGEKWRLVEKWRKKRHNSAPKCFYLQFAAS